MRGTDKPRGRRPLFGYRACEFVSVSWSVGMIFHLARRTSPWRELLEGNISINSSFKRVEESSLK